MFLGRFKLFRYCTKGDTKLAELVPLSHKIVKQSRIGIFRNELHPIHSIGLKSHVLGPFGPFRYYTKVNAKLAELVPLTHKFAKQSRVQIFPNERTRSTPLDAKVIFWGDSDLSLLHESRCKTGRTGAIMAQVRQNKVASQFFATSAPDPLHWTQNSYFGVIRTVSLLHESRCKTGRTGAIIAKVR
jgi:hypothetical protein